MEKVKQVIVVRKDLGMRKGKMIAQVAHASMKVLLDQMFKTQEVLYDVLHLRVYNNTPMYECLNGKFTKVCVSCNSEKELLELYDTAKKLGMPCSLITDAGLTEFGGVPTRTCIAIGSYYSEEIDKVTGDLKLLQMIKNIIRNSGVEEIDADYIVDVFNLDGKKVKFSFDTNSKLLYIVTTSHGNNHTAMNGEFLQVIYSNKRLERKRKLERIVK